MAKISGGTIALLDYREALRSIASESVDLVLTDPPFGIDYQNNYTSRKHDKIEGDGEPFSYEALARETARILRPGCAAFVFTCWSEYGSHRGDFVSSGMTVREPLICGKRPSGKTNLKADWQSNSDWLIYATKGHFEWRSSRLLRNKRAGSIPNRGRKPVAEWKTRFPSCWFGSDFPLSTANPSEQKKWPHPALKNQTFIEWLIQISTDPGGTVVDPFCGAGTVPAASAATGRQYIAGDICERYVEMTRRRVELIVWKS